MAFIDFQPWTRILFPWIQIFYIYWQCFVILIFPVCVIYIVVKKINMEVVIKAMDILNQFGWHHFISDCISHFLYQLPQFIITCMYTWPFLSYSYNDPKYNIHSQYHKHKKRKKSERFYAEEIHVFLLLQLTKIWNTSTKGGIMVKKGAFWLNKLSS